MPSMRILALVALPGVVWLGSALAAQATVTATKDSADFDWKYEMDVDPRDEDQDLDGFADWTQSGTAGQFVVVYTADGIHFQDTQTNKSYMAFLGEHATWGRFPSQFSLATGWTIEASVQVLSQVEGPDAATNILGHFQGESHEGRLNIRAAGQWMGNPRSAGSFEIVGSGTEDNTDGFHVFRMAQSPGENKYSIWRDGVLLLDDQPSAATPPADEDFTWIYFGDLGNQWGGSVQWDYFRFTPGAFAPVAPVVLGDYNNNGTVDAADYVLWRKEGPLQNEGDNPGTVDPGDYTYWQSHFGEPSEAGSASVAGDITPSNVPEPATLSLLLALSLFAGFRSRSRE